MMVNNFEKYKQLIFDFPEFVYHDFHYLFTDNELQIRYHFEVPGLEVFYPEITIPITEDIKKNYATDSIIRNLVFHIGMVELISYWKCVCSPKLIILPVSLTENQILWWKNLYFQGLGEFFYLNNIPAEMSDFMTIQSQGDILAKSSLKTDADKILVPVGGGKDSVVSLELLKSHFNIQPFILNPRPASLQCVEASGIGMDRCLLAYRKIDPALIGLNERGFLNGHTPFSALLAFVTLLVSSLHGIRYVALSNESSANESTTRTSGVNHQYSKSFEFESDFRDYYKEFVCSDIEYFSFLRPLSELQIASLFARYDQYFQIFKSCNAGSKEDKWCGKCPKCLFAYIILSPFMPIDKLKKAFGTNMFEKEFMMKEMDELTGKNPVKPFECVGTVEEVNEALHRYILRYSDSSEVLLKHYIDSEEYNLAGKQLSDITQVSDLAGTHFLEPRFINLIKNALHGDS
ncbi:MAG: hypothetical protein Q7J34_14000 [Bacteroidales bacterium]|nr:hypothetical protein [Bacteroidales bacterium]